MFDEVGIFYRGLLLGFLIAAPVGPVGLLCIRRTLAGGVLIGFATGLGAACSDTLFGAVAAFSVSFIVAFLQHYSATIRIAGGIFMLAVAWRTWHDKARELPKSNEVDGSKLQDTEKLGRAFSAMASSFVITMTNPVTMFATLALVATFGGLQSRVDATTIVSGIFAGSTLWWLMLSGGVALVRDHFTQSRVISVNRLTAAALALLALWAVLSGMKVYLKL